MKNSIAKQQGELDRILAQSRKLGCEGGGFFALFTGRAPQCEPVNAQLQQMRDNLDRMMSDLERIKSGGNTEQAGQRAALIGQLAQNNCGPQYRGGGGGRPGRFSERTVRRHHHQPGRRRRAGRHLPHRLRAHLRRLLFPDLVFDGAEPVCRRPESVSTRVPRCRSPTIQLSQPRRRHEPGRVDQRSALHRAPQRFSLPQGIQCSLLLPAARSKLGRCPEKCRRCQHA